MTQEDFDIGGKRPVWLNYAPAVATVVVGGVLYFGSQGAGKHEWPQPSIDKKWEERSLIHRKPEGVFRGQYDTLYLLHDFNSDGECDFVEAFGISPGAYWSHARKDSIEGYLRVQLGGDWDRFQKEMKFDIEHPEFRTNDVE